MRIKLIVILITGFLIVNTYYDNKYLKKIMTWKKYYTMGLWGFLGLSLYLFFSKHPDRGKDMLDHATKMIQYVPVDKESKQFLKPILNLTGAHSGTGTQRMLTSGNSTKRSVSETKKKYVASNQNWKCNMCKEQLTAWFEVDHKLRLEYGGTNHINNLVALCRNCHGKKTALEKL